MRITGITTQVIEIDAAPRFGSKPIPQNRPVKWHYPLVILHTSSGIDGYSMGYGPHGDGKAMAEILRNTYLPHLLNRNPLETERLWQELRTLGRHLYNLRDTLLGVVDVACWDIRGKALGCSISKLLGVYRSKIKTYATGRVYLPTPEEVYEEAKMVKEGGSHAYKLQLWQGPKLDIPRFYAAREAVGEVFPLMQDAAGGYSYTEALEVGKVLDNLQYKWFEEPIPDRQIDLLRRLDGELSIPLLVGETVSLVELPNYFREPTFGLIRGDVLIKGGITGLQKAFSIAEVYGSNLEIHTAGTPLLDIANLHVASANRNCEFVELHHPIFRFGLRGNPLDSDSEGYLQVPLKPGLGVELDWDWLENHTIEKITIKG